jgi:hypothetical protein
MVASGVFIVLVGVLGHRAGKGGGVRLAAAAAGQQQGGKDGSHRQRAMRSEKGHEVLLCGGGYLVVRKSDTCAGRDGK